jgi:cephalosporin-C deacetylase-like acetyl esterase
VLLALLTLSGCGGSNATASSSESATSSSSPSATSSVPSFGDVMAPTDDSTAPPLPIPTVKPSEQPPAFAELLKMFAYDKSEPLGFERGGAATSAAGNTGQGIQFQSGGATAKGYLVMPKGKGPFPVVVYAHGYGMGADLWLDEAAAMAKKGYAGLLLEEVGTEHFWTYTGGKEIEAWVRYVIQERRALDLIATLPKLDAGRIGFVGLSNGGVLGGLLAGVDRRVKAYVLLGAGAFNRSGALARKSEEGQAAPIRTAAAFARWKAAFSVLDFVTYVSHARGTRMLFLVGKKDTISVQEARDCLAAAPAGKTLHIYEGGHYPIPADANAFWREWMVRNL